MMTSFPNRRKGFTLIELLVVIAIIAILAAILFPVFARARENARRASCQSNLKQIGLGIMQYTQDYDEILPGEWTGNDNESNNTDRWKWMDSVFPYIKSEQIFVCPSDTENRRYIYNKNLPSGLHVNYGSYYVNAYYGAGGGGPRWTNLSRVQAPATTIWALDGQPRWNGDPQAYRMCFNSAGAGDAPMFNYTATPRNGFERWGGRAVERHLDTTNVLFIDGHVKTMKLDALAKVNTSTNAYTYFSLDDD
jgi:prepilin-type N-terminal cleavage/methylation domain-containing protein/prepilin-type processing-associated H-X9-DG protein